MDNKTFADCFPYTNGFFEVSPKHGFIPIKDPLSRLPERY